jgi:hypothetical protein
MTSIGAPQWRHTKTGRTELLLSSPGSAGGASLRDAPLRHDQSLDGSDALPDQDDTASEYRDEPACAGLQLEACDADCRNRPAHDGNEGLNSLLPHVNRQTVAFEIGTDEIPVTPCAKLSVITCPRPEAAKHDRPPRST